MSYEKIAAIVGRLYKQTLKGKIAWEETADEHEFVVSYPEYSVSVLAKPGGYVIVTISNEEGRVVEEVSARELVGMPDNPADSLKDLHEWARRTARGTEKALDKLLDEIPDD